MEIISYIVVNLLLFSSWYIVLFRNKKNITFADRLIGTFILALAQIILTEMVLGVVFKQLFAVPLFYLNISISLGILTFLIVRRSVFPLNVVREIKEQITWLLKTIKSDWMLMSIFTLFSISLCYLLFIGYLFPSYSWDSQFYHLPTIGFILQSGAIENIPYNSLIYTFINVFPKNIDLFFLWNVIFLKSGTIVDLSQLPFTIAGMLAVYSIAVKLEIKDKHAVYCAFLFFFAPVVILQSTTNYVDIAVSVLFLIALNFLLCPRVLLSPVAPSCEASRIGQHEKGDEQESSGGNITLFLAGITSGILLGSKGSGPLFVFALSGMFIIFELRRRFVMKREGLPAEASFGKIIVRYSVYFLMPTVVLGIYWYINNWAYYGNPVFPFQITLFGTLVFPGILTEILHSGPDFLKDMPALSRLFYVWLEKAEYYFYASELSGLGSIWFILFLPAIVFASVYAALNRKYDFLVLSAVILFVFLVHPNNWNTRYVIFIVGLGCLSLGVLVNYFEKRGRIVRLIGLLLAAYTFFISNSPSATTEMIKEFVHLPAKERTVVRMQPFILNITQKKNYGMWEWISRNVSEGETLAYAFTPEMLGVLWNTNFTNKAVYVKAGKFDEWLKKLEENKADYVLVLARPRSPEYFWLSKLAKRRHDPKWSRVYNKFNPAYSDSDYLIMRFKR